MKDRIRLSQWDESLVQEVLSDWHNLGRASRILLAKALALRADVEAELTRQAANGRTPVPGP